MIALRTKTFAALCIAAAFHSTYAAAPLQLNDGGISIDGGGLGAPKLEYPQYVRDGKAAAPRVEKDASGSSVKLAYPNQMIATITRTSETQLKLELTGETKEKDSLVFTMILPGTWKDLATYSVGSKEPQKFPVQLPANEVLDSGRTTTLAIKADNGGFTLSTNPPAWVQLQDNRKWNWTVFQYKMHVNVIEITNSGSMTISVAPEAVAKPVAFVDRYGQPVKKDFPGKITQDQQLKDEIAAEKQFNDALSPPSTDEFGGLPGSREKFNLKATGFFRVDRAGDRDILVTPAGNAFFQLGLCSFQPGDDYTLIRGRRESYEWLPDQKSEFGTAYLYQDAFSFHLANVIRKYGKPYEISTWTERNIERTRRWGFNSAGAFGGYRASLTKMNFPYTPMLPLRPATLKAQIPGLQDIFDPFSENVAANLDSAFAKSVAANANDPLIIGYFLGNEQPFEDIPKIVPTVKGDVPAKKRLVQLLQDRYATIEKFNQAWDLKAASFEALGDMQMVPQTETAHADMHAYYELFMDHYYRLVRDTFNKYDKNHLLIGNRWTPRTANQQIVCAAAGRYMDVISVNYYTQAFDGLFLKRVHTACGANRPILLSEWSFGTSEQGLSGGVVDVKDQKERGYCYRDYVEGAIASRFVVGIQWFSLVDQALTGRHFQGFNGERMNIGMINVADKPYYDFLSECVKTNHHIWDIASGRQEPFKYVRPGIARRAATAAPKLVQIARALPGIKLDGTAKNYPGRPADRITESELVNGKDAGSVEADFRLCWDESNLYLLIAVRDGTPMLNKQTGEGVWSGDAVELFIGTRDMAKPGALIPSDRQLIISAAEKPQVHFFNGAKQYPVQTLAIRDADGKGYVLQAAIPFDALGIKPASGVEFLFDIGIDESLDGLLRQRQFMWNGTSMNSSERGQWGRAKLVD